METTCEEIQTLINEMDCGSNEERNKKLLEKKAQYYEVALKVMSSLRTFESKIQKLQELDDEVSDAIKKVDELCKATVKKNDYDMVRMCRDYCNKYLERRCKKHSTLPLSALNLSARASNQLSRCDVKTVAQVEKLSYEDLLKIRNIGPDTAKEIIEKIREFNEIGQQ